MHFEPRHSPAHVDISGDLVFDRATMSLRRLEFHHVNLPPWIPTGSAGGQVAFVRWPSGLWLPTAWALWGPIEREALVRSNGAGQLMVPRRSVAGRAERQGRVVKVIER